jgi:hypothetical protein
VVDVLLPAGADQAQVLGSFDAASGAFARVPFVDLPATGAAPPGVAAAASPAAPAPAPASPPAQAPDLTPAAAPAVTLSANLMPRLSLLAPSRAAEGGAPGGAGDRTPLLVSELTGELVTAKGPVAGLQPMQIGRVVDAQGITVARVMILRVLDKAVLATVMAGQERIATGQRLLFDQPPSPDQGGPPRAP